MSWYSMEVDCFVCLLASAEHKAVFATKMFLLLSEEYSNSGEAAQSI